MAHPDFDRISLLMTDIGPRLDLMHVKQFAEASTWLIVVDEENVIGAEIDADRDVVMFSAEIGSLAESGNEQLMRTALSYSLLWHANDGFYVGFDPRSRLLKLLAVISTRAIDQERLGQVVGAFVVRLVGWRKLLAKPDVPTEDPLTAISAFGNIRV